MFFSFFATLFYKTKYFLRGMLQCYEKEKKEGWSTFCCCCCCCWSCCCYLKNMVDLKQRYNFDFRAHRHRCFFYVFFSLFCLDRFSLSWRNREKKRNKKREKKRKRKTKTTKSLLFALFLLFLLFLFFMCRDG